MVEPEISIDGRRIGPSHPPYVICEISANHNGSLERAIKMIEAAAETGTDAIKIQTYTADSLTIDCDRPEFRIKGGLWDGYSLHSLYREASTPYEWHPALFKRARELGVTIFATPFDESAVELLACLGAPAYKIASFEAIDLPLVACVARQRKPMIISTGMASLGEIQDAVATSRGNGADGIALLHCVSSYPAPVEDSNIRTVPHLAEAFGVVSGLSDHTPGVAVAVASVALGGCLVEKHFTLSRADGGPDAAFSLEPHEFKQLVAGCKDAWKALGRVHYDLEVSEKAGLVFRRSLYVVADVAAGEKLTERNVRSIRPGNGLLPKDIGKVVGRRAARDLERGHPLAWTDIESRE
ncbi:MAG: pseudaminic acid synthase [Methylocella sp.]